MTDSYTHILYVDDYPFDRQLVRDALEIAGNFILTEAASKAEFETRMADFNYDLVLSDFNILGFEGLQVLERIKEEHPDVPVIIVTGTGSEEVAVEAMKRGAADYIIKTPSHIRRLPHTIYYILEQQRLRQEQYQAYSQIHFQADILRNVRDAVVVTDLEGRINYWNDGATELFGYTAEEMRGQTPAILYPNQDSKEMAANLQQILFDQDYSGIWRGRRKDGSDIWVDIRTTVMHNEEGVLCGLIGVSKDVTKVRKAQKDLERREQEFRSLAENLPVIVSRFDRQFRHLYVSPQIEDVTQIPAAAFLGKTNREMDMPPALVERWEATLTRVFETGLAEKIEFTYDTPKKEMVCFSSQLVPELAADGSVATVLVINRDVTHEKQQAKTLQIRAQQQAVVGNLGQLALSDADLSSIIETAMTMAAQTLEVEYAHILELMPEGKGMRRRGGVGWAVDVVGEATVTTDAQTQAGYALLSEVAVIVEDYKTETKFTLPPLLKDRRIRSGLSVIVGGQQKAFGVLEVYTTRPRSYSQDDIHFLRAIANILAETVQRNLLTEQIQKHTLELEQRIADRTRELMALYEITLIASQTFDWTSTLEQVLRQTIKSMRCQAGYIALRDGDQKNLQLATWQGFSPETELPDAGAPFLGEDDVQHIINRNQPIVKLATSAGEPDRKLLPNVGMALCVPLRADRKTLGILAVVRVKEQPEFNAEEISLITSIADHVGLVVESAQLRQQAGQAAVVEERARLARDIHDSVLQLLYSLHLFIESGIGALELNRMDLVERSFTELKVISVQAVKEMRLLVFELRPLLLGERDDLINALQERLEAVEKRAEIKSRLQYDEEVARLSVALQDTLYYIAREVLNNIIKHALATDVVINIKVSGDQLVMSIVDDGVGFDPQLAQSRGGLGLISIRERVNKVNGTLEITSVPGQGAKVEVKLDL